MPRTETKFNEKGEAVELKTFNDAGQLIFHREKVGGVWRTILDIKETNVDIKKDPTPGFGEITKEEGFAPSGRKVEDITFKAGEGVGSATVPTGTPQKIVKTRVDPRSITTEDKTEKGTERRTFLLEDTTTFRDGKPLTERKEFLETSFRGRVIPLSERRKTTLQTRQGEKVTFIPTEEGQKIEFFGSRGFIERRAKELGVDVSFTDVINQDTPGDVINKALSTPGIEGMPGEIRALALQTKFKRLVEKEKEITVTKPLSKVFNFLDKIEHNVREKTKEFIGLSATETLAGEAVKVAIPATVASPLFASKIVVSVPVGAELFIKNPDLAVLGGAIFAVQQVEAVKADPLGAISEFVGLSLGFKAISKTTQTISKMPEFFKSGKTRRGKRTKLTITDLERKRAKSLALDVRDAKIKEVLELRETSATAFEVAKLTEDINVNIAETKAGFDTIKNVEVPKDITFSRSETKPIIKDLLEIYGADLPTKTPKRIFMTPKKAEGFVITQGSTTLIKTAEFEIGLGQGRSSKVINDLFKEPLTKKPKTPGLEGGIGGGGRSGQILLLETPQKVVQKAKTKMVQIQAIDQSLLFDTKFKQHNLIGQSQQFSFKSLSLLGGATKQRQAQKQEQVFKFAPLLSTKQAQASAFKFQFDTLQRQKVTTKQTAKLDLDAFTALGFKQDLVNLTLLKQGQLPITGQGFEFPPVIVQKNDPFKGFKFKSPLEKKPKKRKAKKKKGKTRTARSPSLGSLVFGLPGKTKGLFTGLEIRGL